MDSTIYMSKPNTKLIMASCDIVESCVFGHSSFRLITLPNRSSQRSVIASVAAPKAVTIVSKPSTTLAHVWREIQGSNNWENLMEPLNPLLRDEIIRYGEFISVCYKAFNFNPGSKRYLNCMYGKKNLLQEVGMVNSGYEVTRYIYATPSIDFLTPNGFCCGRWIGYVAVSSDDRVKTLGRRDVVVVFRGTITNREWIANFMSSLTPAKLDPVDARPDVKVELGFLNLYTSEDRDSKYGVRSCREQLISEVSRIINKYKGEEISITMAGHSMGSSIALLLAYDISELGLDRYFSKQNIPITVYSFAGPRVGNSGFKGRCEELGIKVLRIVNVNDPITKLPGVVFNENFKVLGGKYELPWRSSCYTHIGVELALDFFNMQNPSCVHDIDTYIMLLKFPQSVQVHRNGVDMMNMAKNFLSNAQKFENPPWKALDPLRNVGNLFSLLFLVITCSIFLVEHVRKSNSAYIVQILQHR